MPWETRNGKGRYYTRCRWQDGRCVRKYVGSGKKGQDAAKQDAEKRAKSRRNKEIYQQRDAEEKAARDSIERPILELARVVEMLMEVTMQQAGYHKPKRWKWRRRNV